MWRSGGRRRLFPDRAEHEGDSRAGACALGDRVLVRTLARAAHDDEVALADGECVRRAAAGRADEEAAGGAERDGSDDGFGELARDIVAVPGDAVAAVAVERGRDAREGGRVALLERGAHR